MLKLFLLLFLFNYCYGITTLNTTNFYFTFWLDDLISSGSNVTVCTDSIPYFPIRLYVNSNDKLLEDFSVFDSKDTSNFIGNLNSNLISTSSPLHPRNVLSSSGCFTILRTKATNVPTSATLFFLRDQVASPRCTNYKNGTVFQASYNYNSTFIFPSICEVFILSPPSPFPSVPIESITATSLFQDNRIVIKSAVNKNVYLDTAIASAPIIWQNLRFYTPALSVKIYQNIVVKLSNKTASFSKTDSSLQKCLIASPSYGGFKQILNSNLLSFSMNFDANMTIIFDVKQMDYGQQLILQNNDLKQNISVGFYKQFYGKSFTIFYAQNQISGTSFLVHYTIAPANFNTKTIHISATNPMHVELLENLQPGEAATVCVQSGDIGISIDLYVANANEYSFKLYASDESNYFSNLMFLQNLNNSRKNNDGILTKIPLPSFYKQCITVYREYVYFNLTVQQAIVIFKFYDGFAECNVRKPIFSTVNLTNYYNVPCRFTILAPQYSNIMFSNMSMITNQSVTISSVLNQKTLIELRNDEINLWQNNYFYTPVLGVIVPVNGFFSFTIGYSGMRIFAHYGVTINQVIANQKGVIASPAYSGFYSSSIMKTGIIATLSTYSYGNSIKFNPTEVSSYNTFYIENVSEKKNYTMESSNNNLILNGSQFNIWYLNDQNNAFKINYQFLGSTSSSPATFKSMTSITVSLFISLLATCFFNYN